MTIDDDVEARRGRKEESWKVAASLPLHHDALHHEKPIAAQPSTTATHTTIMTIAGIRT